MDTSVLIFKVISNFTHELGNVFGDTYRPLKLYAHLINKTTIANDKPIKKHIDAFRVFCTSNHDAIINKDSSLLKVNSIKYSNRVYIDMKKILRDADKETETVIWKHLLTISAMVDPGSQAKDILKELANENKEGANEINFLEKVINQVEENVKPNSNPMDAVSDIMKSGIFSELVSGMGSGLQNGQLDMTKLMGTVQQMVSKINEENPEESNEMMNMMNTILGNMSNVMEANDSQDTNRQPDLSALLGPMMNTLNKASGGGSGENPSIPNLLEMMSVNEERLTLEDIKEED